MPRTAFDRVNESDGKPPRRDEGERATRRHPLEADELRGDRIEAAEIVEQPAVDVRVDQCALQFEQRVGRKHPLFEPRGSIDCPPIRTPLAGAFTASGTTDMLHRTDA